MRLRGNAPMRVSRFAVALAAALALPLTPASGACVPSDHDALLILDLSYSMLRAAGNGVSRFNAARQAVSTVVDLMPNDGRVALRFYGSEAVGRLNTCVDSILAVPFATAAVNRAPIKAALANAHARGLTPIDYALQQAVGDFQGDTYARTIILVSDGAESCDGTPCATAALLASQGVVINTVGFQADLQGRRQMECIASATGGKFFTAPSAVQLADRILEAMGVCAIALAPRLIPNRKAIG